MTRPSKHVGEPRPWYVDGLKFFTARWWKRNWMSMVFLVVFLLVAQVVLDLLHLAG